MLESGSAKGVSSRSGTPAPDWVVYLLRCADGTLYTGITTDLSRRLRQHNGELVGGARYTRARRPVQAVWQWRCNTRSEAARKEWQVRRLPREHKQALAGDSSATEAIDQ